MKIKEESLKDNLDAKEKPKIPDTPSSFKKTESDQSEPPCLQNVPKKNFSPMASIRDKIDTILGRSKTDTSELKKFNEFKNQAIKQSQTGLAKIKEHRNTKLESQDNESLSCRIYELEDHLIELHSEFDDFVLKSDQFLNYEQFVELRKDSEERIRTLDNLQKSIEESKNQIFKDTAYMDDIIEGFAHLKKKIDMLEKKTDDISKKNGSGSNQPNFMDKFLGKPTTMNPSGSTESVTLASLKKEIAELHGQMETIKKSEEKSITGMDNTNQFKRQIDEMEEKINKMNNNRQPKENIEEDIIKRIDIETMLNTAINQAKDEMKSNVDSRIDALKHVQTKVIDRADLEKLVQELNKSQDQLKEELSSLKRELENQAFKSVDSKKEQNESVEKAMSELRKEMNGKIPCESKIVRDKEISEIRQNIQKLKAISQEL